MIQQYRDSFRQYLEDTLIESQVREAVAMSRSARRVIFIGNGGSNSICSHMMEDFIKVGRKPAIAFTDPALITCFANDYGYPEAIREWLRVIHQPGDLLYAISSSGESANILQAARYIKEQGDKVITLTGFQPENSLSQIGDLNFRVPVKSYGIVECFHQTLIHMVLDIMVAEA